MATKRISVAFSGSGFLAPAEAGFAVGLMQNNCRIVEVAGTSGGSIVATAVACGFSANDLTNMVFAGFPKGIAKLSLFTAMHSLMQDSFWLNSGDILQEYLFKRFGNKTFSDLQIPLTIMATNLTDKATLEFSKTATPNIKIAFACRCSSSVPYVYKPMKYNEKLVVDGGVYNNIPTQKLKAVATKKVGIRILDGGNYKLSSVFDMSKQLISSLLDANEDNLVAWAKATGASIKEVNCNPYNFLDAEMTQEQLHDLFNRGKQAALDLLKSPQFNT